MFNFTPIFNSYEAGYPGPREMITESGVKYLVSFNVWSDGTIAIYTSMFVDKHATIVKSTQWK